MVEYKVIDNFLSKYLLDKIIFQLNQSDIHWKYNQTNDEDGLVSPLGENYYFVHMIYYNTVINQTSFQIVREILEKLNIQQLFRIKINLYTRTENLIHHSDHRDMDISHKGGLFSLNTCDGFTVIEGKKIESVANRMIYFDPSIPHHSTNCTNAPARMNININYY